MNFPLDVLLAPSTTQPWTYLVFGLIGFAFGFTLEMSGEQLSALLAEADALGLQRPEVEVFAWGRMPLAHSARCFTARHHGRGKDDCGFESRRESPPPLRGREIRGLPEGGEDSILLSCIRFVPRR